MRLSLCGRDGGDGVYVWPLVVKRGLNYRDARDTLRRARVCACVGVLVRLVYARVVYLLTRSP